MIAPYYADEHVTLYHGDCREVLPLIEGPVDCVVTDPPYGETSLEWDRWPTGWPSWLVGLTDSLWCFGSLRMFLDRGGEFSEWQFGQDVVWRKHNGSGFAADRFRRVHEHAVHWYRGAWLGLHRDVPTVPGEVRPTAAIRNRAAGPAHTGALNPGSYEYGDTRLMPSVIEARSMHGTAVHPTEKPAGIIRPLVHYSCPRGGVVLDPFAGSGSTLVAARATDRRAVGIEGRERYCELAARRLSQGDLFAGLPS